MNGGCVIASDRFLNRWNIAIAAVCVQICLGGAYGWSVFKNPLMRTEHWSETSVQLNFSLIFLFFAFGSMIGGFSQDRFGPRKVGTVAAILNGTGYIVAGFSASHHFLEGLYLGYGLLAGLGLGMGYICPVATLVKWFPDRRGLMTGVAVCGYGFGAVLMSPFAAWEIIHYGVPATFYTLGVIYLLVLFAGAQLFLNPPAGWRPAGWEPRTAVAKAAGVHDFTVSETLATWQFYALFFLTVVNLWAGFMIVSQASPMAQEMVGMTVLKAAAMVGLISVFNGLGRVFWAWASDYGGRARIYFVLIFIQTVVFFLLPHLHDWTLFSVAFGLIGFCYGGGFGTMPSFVADYFGAKAMGGIYGIILFGSNVTAAFSPVLIAHIHQSLGSYAPAIRVTAILMFCVMFLPLIMHRPRKHEASQRRSRSANESTGIL